MNDLNKAYEIINSIPLDASRDLALGKAKLAYEESKLCSEAAIIMSHCFEKFIDKERVLLENIGLLIDVIYNQNLHNEIFVNNLNMVNYELGSLYYEEGMFKKALKVFEKIKDSDIELVKYKLMGTYAFLEDDKTEEYYKTLVNNLNETEFVRISFTYMIYLYKKAELDKARELLKNIYSINPDIKKALKEEEVKNEEAYRILKNNSLLINSCPYIIRDLVI